MHQSKIWQCYITNKANFIIQVRGRVWHFANFRDPTIYQKIAFSILPIPNIGNFKTFIYKNAFSRPPIPKIVNFKTFYTKIYFRNLKYQKNCIFETPDTKNALSRPLHTKIGTPIHFLCFFTQYKMAPHSKWSKFTTLFIYKRPKYGQE